jgi:hypothetical protein
VFFYIHREGNEENARDSSIDCSGEAVVGDRHGEAADREEKKRNLERRERLIWSSKKESMVDALEPPGEEGRGKLRKATGRSTHPAIRRLPNGVTRLA